MATKKRKTKRLPKVKIWKSAILGDWHWRVEAPNGEIIADSAEGYENKADCIAGWKLTKKAVM